MLPCNRTSAEKRSIDSHELKSLNADCRQYERVIQFMDKHRLMPGGKKDVSKLKRFFRP